MVLPTTALLGLAGTLLGLLYLAYQRALPKPLPGIPFLPGSAHSVLGDLPELLRHMRAGDHRAFLCGLAARLRSPLVQLLVPPAPVLVVADFGAAADVLRRRARAFERPAFTRAALGAMIPHHHIGMRTADPRFRRNRALVRDLMAPPFLHAVNAPRIGASAARLVALWRLKARAAAGRPFDAAEDVARLLFDVIKDAALGRGEATLIGRYLDQLRRAGLGADGAAAAAADEEVDRPFPFPAPPEDEVMEAQKRMNAAITKPVFWFPRTWFHALHNLLPHMREAFAWKNKMLRRQFALAVKRMEANEPLESALDYMIQREIGAAKKDGREPQFESPTLYDELYGYIGAGHDTTATTVTWGLKHLAQEPAAQRKARQNLREAYAAALAEGRPPTADEIIHTRAPYLDAVIDEILRLSSPLSVIGRQAVVDTTLMGRRVPKGTNVFLAVSGAGLVLPSVADADVHRSSKDGAAEGGGRAGGDDDDDDDDNNNNDDVDDDGGGNKKKASHVKRANWDGADPEAFVPERWLARDAEGRLVYDAQAGPMLSFSLGIRGCFGKRLAYLTLRMIFTLLLWNFELQPVPVELGSWKAYVSLIRRPVECYVRLAEAK